MSACERCWEQAFIESRIGPESQAEAYRRLLKENEEAHRAPDEPPESVAP
jgi:hypothetical protein